MMMPVLLFKLSTVSYLFNRLFEDMKRGGVFGVLGNLERVIRYADKCEVTSLYSSTG